MDEFDCDKCRGTGGVPYRRIELINPCAYCGGKGKVDWIQNATNMPPVPLDKEKYWQFMDYNIKRLEQELREACMEMNIQVRIQYEQMPDRYTSINPTIVPNKKLWSGGI